MGNRLPGRAGGSSESIVSLTETQGTNSTGSTRTAWNTAVLPGGTRQREAMGHTLATPDGDMDGYFTSEERKKFEGSCTFAPPKFKEQIRWRRGELLGSGAFGRVYLALHTDTGELMAAKQIVLTQQGEECDKALLSLENEINLMKRLDHVNIVRYWGYERTEDTFTIFMEYVSGGSIASLLKKFGPFNETLVRVYTKQILEGLHYLHCHRIMHRDIKGANILVDRGGVCKLSDFGAAKGLAELSAAANGPQSLRGTPYWMAPEVVRQVGHGRQADIWSVGCTIIEMATGKPPWAQFEAPVSALFHIAVSNEPPPFPDTLSDTAHDFLRLCFQRDPKMRPNAYRLLQHPFITSSFISSPGSGIGSSNGANQVIAFDEGEAQVELAIHSRRSSAATVASRMSTVGVGARDSVQAIDGTGAAPVRHGGARRQFPFGSISNAEHSNGETPPPGPPQLVQTSSFRMSRDMDTIPVQRTPSLVTSIGSTNTAKSSPLVNTNAHRLVFNGASAAPAAAPTLLAQVNNNGSGNSSGGGGGGFFWNQKTQPLPSPGAHSTHSALSSGHSSAPSTAPSPRSAGDDARGYAGSSAASSGEFSYPSHGSTASREHVTDAVDWHRSVGDRNSALYESYRSYVEGPSSALTAVSPTAAVVSTPTAHSRGSVKSTTQRSITLSSAGSAVTSYLPSSTGSRNPYASNLDRRESAGSEDGPSPRGLPSPFRAAATKSLSRHLDDDSLVSDTPGVNPFASADPGPAGTMPGTPAPGARTPTGAKRVTHWQDRR